MAYIQFLGAAGTVTGSKHLINTCDDYSGKSGFQALVDCGMFQGQKEWRERNWQDTPIPARDIDAVILTHAHLDHSGWIPRLVKSGFRGPIYATPATIDLCGILLPDSGHLQEEDANFYNKHNSSKHKPALPLYNLEEAQESLKYFSRCSSARPRSCAPSFPSASSARPTSWVRRWSRSRFGPTARRGDCSLPETSAASAKPASRPAKWCAPGPVEGESADLVVMESTYGNRQHPQTDPRPDLAAAIKKTIERGGTVVIPAFAVERTQKFLFILKEMMEAGQIPRVPVYADSPMAIKAVQVFLEAHRRIQRRN